MPELLEFEEPIGVLLKEIEALSMLPSTPDRRGRDRPPAAAHRIDSRRALPRADAVAARAGGAASRARPTVLDYVDLLFTEFTEIHGDRRFADDHAIVTGFARYKGEPVLVVGHHKGGSDTKQKIFRNFGYAQARGLPQGAARDGDGREVRPADHRLRRYAGGVPRRRIGRARHRRGDCAQPARDGDARRADHRDRAAARAAAAERSASRSATGS